MQSSPGPRDLLPENKRHYKHGGEQFRGPRLTVPRRTARSICGSPKYPGDLSQPASTVQVLPYLEEGGHSTFIPVLREFEVLGKDVMLGAHLGERSLELFLSFTERTPEDGKYKG